MTVPRHKLSSAHGLYRAFSVASLSAWNTLAYYLRDPALEPNSFSRQVKIFLFAHYQVQRIEYKRNAVTKRCIFYFY